MSPTGRLQKDLRAALSPLGAVAIFPLPRTGKVWLQHREGDGGEFDRKEVQRHLEDPKGLEAYFWRKQ